MNYNLKLYNILISLMVTIMLICDTLSFKVITISNLNFAASGVIFPLSFFLACIVTEVYGYDLAGRIVWIQMLCQAIFILSVNIIVILPTHIANITSWLYDELYKNLWRVFIGSTISVPLAYFSADFLMSKIKIKSGGKVFFARYFIASAIGKAILVSVSYPINFYGQMGKNEILHMMLNTFIYKMIIAVFIMPIAYIIAMLIKKVEKTDFYDYGISYNPILVFKDSNTGQNLYSKIKSRGK